MKKKKLTYKFNNPNSNKETAEMLIKLFAEANKKKVDCAIKQEMQKD